jgi:hypothetical protein
MYKKRIIQKCALTTVSVSPRPPQGAASTREDRFAPSVGGCGDPPAHPSQAANAGILRAGQALTMIRSGGNPLGGRQAAKRRRSLRCNSRIIRK